MAAPWTSGLVPAGWGELLSVPSALGALRAGLAGPVDPWQAARAAAVLAAVAARSFANVRAEVGRAPAEDRLSTESPL
jgi:hypothetical protein